jgi:Mn-dependent DtxR family transcriptional regulator
VYKVLVDTAKKSGKSYAEGLRVTIARRTLAMRAKVSTRTLRKAIARLEDAGLLYRDLGDREADKAGAFVLRADVPQVGERGAQGEEIPRTSKVYDPCGVHLRAPRLRWSDPGGKARAGVVKGTVQVRQARMESRPAISRLGKIRGAILDALDAAGGAATLKEIADTLHKKRPRDIRRRSLPMLEEAGIITVHDDMVSLTCNWLEALDNARKLAREIDGDAGVDGSREKGAETLDRERYARERVAYRDPGRDKQDPAPAEGETRERREDYPRRRREAIERAITRLFTDNPEFRDRRAGQIVCALVMRYIGPDFPRGPDGMPKDSEVEEILSGVAA